MLARNSQPILLHRNFVFENCPSPSKKNMVRSLNRPHRVGDSFTIASCTSAYVHKWIFVLVPSKTLDEHPSHHMDPPGFRSLYISLIDRYS